MQTSRLTVKLLRSLNFKFIAAKFIAANLRKCDAVLHMGVTRKFSREGHNFQPNFFSPFCTKSFKAAIFGIFRTKVGAFKTYKIKKSSIFRPPTKKGKI